MENPRTKSLLHFFSTNPLVGAIGSLASVISIPLSIYFYWDARQTRELTFSVNPGRVEIINTQESSRFSAIFRGRPVTGNITAAKIAVWNAGTIPITKADILSDEVTIYTSPPARILEASVTRRSRDTTQFRLREDQYDRGRVVLDWKALDRNDGGVVEIIYNGTPGTEFHLAGDILGQADGIESFYNRIGFESPEDEFKSYRALNKRRVYFAPIFLIALIAGAAHVVRSELRKERTSKKFVVVACIWIIVMSGCMIAIYMLSSYPEPPRGL